MLQAGRKSEDFGTSGFRSSGEEERDATGNFGTLGFQSSGELERKGKEGFRSSGKEKGDTRKGTSEPWGSGVSGKEKAKGRNFETLGFWSFGEKKEKTTRELRILEVPEFQRRQEKGTTEPGSGVPGKEREELRNLGVPEFREGERRGSKGKELRNLGVLEFRGREEEAKAKTSSKQDNLQFLIPLLFSLINWGGAGPWIVSLINSLWWTKGVIKWQQVSKGIRDSKVGAY